MLGSKDAIATVAVKDLPAAREFYQKILGLSVVATQGEEVVTFGSGKTLLNVYRSEFAGTNKATAAMWDVGDVDAVAHELKQRGVAFERYDMPGLTLDGDVYSGEGMKVAWFKDLDGNILSIIGGG
jgi:catechol 2,3-dioxygenase-like lactoylglutathione lyase family enzyme